MKRIIYALLATVSGLVLLFSYRTSLEAVMPVADAPAASETGSGASVPSRADDTEEDAGTDDEAEAQDSPSGSAGTSSQSNSSDSTSGSGGSSASSASSSLADGTYTGSSVNTRFGPVQVQIVVSGGVITSADAIDYPTSNPRDRQINQTAVPILVSETLAAQSTRIDMVSGATYTSDGYIRSLQSAIDEATA